MRAVAAIPAALCWALARGAGAFHQQQAAVRPPRPRLLRTSTTSLPAAATSALAEEGSIAPIDPELPPSIILLEERISTPSDLDAPLDEVKLPEPLTGLERATRAVSFWSRIAPVLLKYYFLGKEQNVTQAQWEDMHDWGSDMVLNTIKDLKGFYVKTGQVLSTRVDLFPKQYTDKLQVLQDKVDPIPTNVVKSIISSELLEGEPLSILFRSFDEEPLGSASIAQVHKAVLLDGRTVAVKVQRPAEEPKLRGDIANLKAFSKRARTYLPVDYYPVFCELERALTNELDARAEAMATEKIAASVAFDTRGNPQAPPLIVPRPIPGLSSSRVMIMEYVHGIALNALAEKMKDVGVEEESPEARALGLSLLTSLTEAFARMIFGPGFIHGDPHPGNILITPSGGVALIDCGQVKQIPVSMKLKLARIMKTVNLWGKPGGPTTSDLAAQIRDIGVDTVPGAGDEALAATVLLLFGPQGISLPGGYSNQELSQSSPLKQLDRFPQELVMLGRACVLIRGIASKLKIKWNLAEKWSAAADDALICGVDGCTVPVYAAVPAPLGGSAGSFGLEGRPKFKEVRQSFRGVRQLMKAWALGKSMESLPDGLRKRLIVFSNRVREDIVTKDEA